MNPCENDEPTGRADGPKAIWQPLGPQRNRYIRAEVRTTRSNQFAVRKGVVSQRDEEILPNLNLVLSCAIKISW